MSLKGMKLPAQGIDRQIQKHQGYMHSAVIADLCIEVEDYDCYSRCYRNAVKDADGRTGYIAQPYVSSGDYRGDAFVDDRVKLTSFYGVGDSRRMSGGTGIADVHLVFFANVCALEPGIVHRADEELITKLTRIMNTQGSGYGFSLRGIETGEKVLAEYNSTRTTTGLYARDMQPFVMIRFNFDVQYQPHQLHVSEYRTNPAEPGEPLI